MHVVHASKCEESDTAGHDEESRGPNGGWGSRFWHPIGSYGHLGGEGERNKSHLRTHALKVRMGKLVKNGKRFGACFPPSHLFPTIPLVSHSPACFPKYPQGLSGLNTVARTRRHEESCTYQGDKYLLPMLLLHLPSYPLHPQYKALSNSHV